MIVGVLLGAGTSRRLGRPKQTLSFGGRSLLAHVLDEAQGAGSLDRVILVVGDERPDDLQLAARTTVVHNEQPTDGCSSSLRSALADAEGADAIVMLLGDMPGVTSRIIDTVVSAFRAAPSWAAVTRYDDALGHPLVFGAGAFGDLRTLHGDKAVWKILDRAAPGRVARIDIADALPRDIDTWEDYEAVHAAFGFDPRHRTSRPPATQISDGAR